MKRLLCAMVLMSVMAGAITFGLQMQSAWAGGELKSMRADTGSAPTSPDWEMTWADDFGALISRTLSETLTKVTQITNKSPMITALVKKIYLAGNLTRSAAKAPSVLG